MKKSKQMEVILQLLYNADQAAQEYPEALSDDLVFDLRKLISFIEEDQNHAAADEFAKEFVL